MSNQTKGKGKAKVYSIGNIAQDMAKNIMERVEGIEAKADFDLREIPLDEIAYHPDNKYGMRNLEELAESLRQHGQQHNAVVRPYSDPNNPKIKYQLISGERRHRALQMIGKTTIFAKVEEVDDLKALELLEVINLQTRELSEMERAEAVQRLYLIVEQNRDNGVDYEGKKTREIVAGMISKDTDKISPATVAQYKKLNDLIPEFKELVDSGDISRELAYQYSQLPVEQQKLIYEAFNQGKNLTAKEAKDLKSKLQQNEADREQIINDYKRKLEEKELEAEKAANRLKALEQEKSKAENELNNIKAKLTELQNERAEQESKMKKDIESLRAKIKAEVEKEVEKQNNAKIKTLQDELDSLLDKQKKDIQAYKKRAAELENQLIEKDKILKEKLVEKNITEGNKAIQYLARQAQKALMMLLDELDNYVHMTGFELTEETKEALAEVNKYQRDIMKE